MRERKRGGKGRGEGRGGEERRERWGGRGKEDKGDTEEEEGAIHCTL